MRDWVIVYYMGIPFIGGHTNSAEIGYMNHTMEGDFMLVSRCTASELPYPFWWTGGRTVYIRDYDNLLSELSHESLGKTITLADDLMIDQKI